jgi:uncharacterized membrane protein YkvA (DUF1232 family)
MQLIAILKQRARQLKSEAQVLTTAYTDKRNPFTAKILIGITVGSLLRPVDLIPYLIPVLGLLDDLIAVPLLISVSITTIPPLILAEARQKANNNTKTLKKAIGFLQYL